MNILFTCVGRRNYLINYFKEALNGNGKIIATDADSNSSALVAADLGIIVPLITDPDYIPTLSRIIEMHKIKAVISLNDLELPLLSKHKYDLEIKGAKIIISDEQAISNTFDKYNTFKFINSIGLNTPKTFVSLEKAKEAISNGELSFPLVLKPRWGTASLGIEFPETMEELDLIYKLLKIRLRKTILNNISQTDFDNAILIQEKLNGQEYGLDVINDLNCNYFGTFTRKKIRMRAGETDIATSVIDSRFNEVGRKIGEHLKQMGTMDCDAFMEHGKVYVLEMNPRFGGGYPFSHEAGVNTAALYIEWLKGNTTVDQFVSYKDGLTFSKYTRLMHIPKAL